MTQELQETIKGLSVRDKRILLHSLSAELSAIDRTERAQNAQARGRELKDIMTAVSGYDVSLKDRMRPIPDCRAIIASQMRREGYTLKEIGLALGVDHATIIHYIGVVEAIVKYPMSAQYSYKIYQDFNRAIGL